MPLSGSPTQFTNPKDIKLLDGNKRDSHKCLLWFPQIGIERWPLTVARDQYSN